MGSHFRGILVMTLILISLPLLKSVEVCPSSCQCLQGGAVKCVGYNITDIPKQMPLHTYYLQIIDTNLNVINERSLADKVLLLRFGLIQSHLHTIHPTAFHVAPQLKSVMLSSNDLIALPSGVFHPLTQLEQLFLDGNKLETLTPDMFEGLVNLLQLDLSQNNLGKLSSDAFNGLNKLLSLNLGRNFIKKLPPTIFSSLTELKQLLIFHNEVEELEAGFFDGLVSLEELTLHHNQITSLPPQVFWSLKNLMTLTLSSNRLQAIPEKSFYYMPKLRKLTIYNNPLLSLPDQLMGHMPDMREFYLYGTNLTTVPGSLFANMSGLVSLNFHLNEWLSELPSDLFCCLPKLFKLSLKSNNLTHLHPQLFSTLTRLGELFLNDNKLQSLPDNIFHGLGQLLLIDLKCNQLKSLTGDIFLSNAVLKTLSLSGNPWDCTCSIRGFAKWIRDNEQVVLDRGYVTCYSPVHRQNSTINSLPEEEFKTCDSFTVTNSPPNKHNLHEPTKTSRPVSTSGQNLVFDSKTAPSTSTTTEGGTQHVVVQRITSTAQPSVLHTTTLPKSPKALSIGLPDSKFLRPTESPLTYYVSPVFYDRLVVEEGHEFIHHNRHKGWVYVWFLPSQTTLTWVLMFSHIFLMAIALSLSLATICGIYVLNKTMDELKIYQKRYQSF